MLCGTEWIRVSAAADIARRSLVESLAVGGMRGKYFFVVRIVWNGEVLGKLSTSLLAFWLTPSDICCSKLISEQHWAPLGVC